MLFIKNIIGIIITIWCCFAGLGHAQIKSNNTESVNVTTVHYELNLRIDYPTEKLIGNAVLRVKNVRDKSIRRISLLLYRLLDVESITDGRDKHLKFEQKIVSFEDFEKMQVNAIRIYLDEAMPPNEIKKIQIRYKGHLLGYSEVGYKYIRDHISPEFTIIRNDSRAFPMPGVPSLEKNKKIPLPNFDYEANITVPDSLVVANGGKLINKKQQDGNITYTYASQTPSWRMDFAIAVYKQLKKNKINIFYFPGDSRGASGVMEAATQSINLFSHWFGNLNENQTLTFIEIPNGWGSQKDATTIIQSAAAFKNPKRHREVYHEISHMWDVPPLDLPSTRWNEGMASFLEYLAVEHIEDREIVDNRANLLIRWLKNSVPHNPEWIKVSMKDYGKAQLTDLSYSVGALMFDLLYRLEGKQEFNSIISGFRKQYKTTGATLSDFIEYTSRLGSKDLTGFFHDWVYTTNWYDRISEAQTVSDIVVYYQKHNGD